MPNAPCVASTDARLDAVELFLQQLLLVLECEPRFTAAHLDRWMHIATRRMQCSGSTPPATVAALRALHHRVIAL